MKSISQFFFFCCILLLYTACGSNQTEWEKHNLKGLWISEDFQAILVISDSTILMDHKQNRGMSLGYDVKSDSILIVWEGSISEKPKTIIENVNSRNLIYSIESGSIRLEGVIYKKANNSKIIKSFAIASDGHLGFYEKIGKQSLTYINGSYSLEESEGDNIILSVMDKDVLLYYDLFGRFSFADRDFSSNSILKDKYVDLTNFVIDKISNEQYYGSTKNHDGDNDGWQITWNKNGVRTDQSFFLNSKRYGYHTMWDEKGQLISQQHYYDDEKHGSSIVFGLFTNQDLEISNYHHNEWDGKYQNWNNRLYRSGNYSDGRAIGRWKTVSSANKMMLEENGKVVGRYTGGTIPSYFDAVVRSMDTFFPYSYDQNNSKRDFSIEVSNFELIEESHLGMFENPNSLGYFSTTLFNEVLTSMSFSSSGHPKIFRVSFDNLDIEQGTNEIKIDYETSIESNGRVTNDGKTLYKRY